MHLTQSVLLYRHNYVTTNILTIWVCTLFGYICFVNINILYVVLAAILVHKSV